MYGEQEFRQRTLQEALDEQALARRSDPQTSHEAARSVKVNVLESYVLHALKMNPQGLTASEIAEKTGHPLNTISPRTAPLQRKGFIKDSGTRRDRKIVWVAI